MQMYSSSKCFLLTPQVRHGLHTPDEGERRELLGEDLHRTPSFIHNMWSKEAQVWDEWSSSCTVLTQMLSLWLQCSFKCEAVILGISASPRVGSLYDMKISALKTGVFLTLYYLLLRSPHINLFNKKEWIDEKYCLEYETFFPSQIKRINHFKDSGSSPLLTTTKKTSPNSLQSECTSVAVTLLYWID